MADGTVLLRRSALGDVVLLGAVTSAVEGPVTVVTSAPLVPLARRLRGVTSAVPWGTSLPPGRVVDLQGGHGSSAIPASARIDKRSVRRRVRQWLGVGAPRPPVTALYAEACGVAPSPPPWIDVPDVPRDTLALAPGAAWATKRWAPERFAAVGRAWVGPVVVLGGPGEEDVCRVVADGIPGAATLVERGFDATIDVLAATAVAVAGDTGLLHLAAACGAKVVALFGPTDPADGFWVHPGEVVERELPCRPCTLHGRDRCPLGDLRCMDLPADAVIAAVERCAG